MTYSVLKRLHREGAVCHLNSTWLIMWIAKFTLILSGMSNIIAPWAVKLGSLPLLEWEMQSLGSWRHISQQRWSMSLFFSQAGYVSAPKSNRTISETFERQVMPTHRLNCIRNNKKEFSDKQDRWWSFSFILGPSGEGLLGKEPASSCIVLRGWNMGLWLQRAKQVVLLQFFDR